MLGTESFNYLYATETSTPTRNVIEPLVDGPEAKSAKGVQVTCQPNTVPSCPHSDAFCSL